MAKINKTRYLAYSASLDGTVDFSLEPSVDRKFVGEFFGFELDDPLDSSVYTWSFLYPESEVDSLLDKYKPPVYQDVLEYDEVLKAGSKMLIHAHTALDIMTDGQILTTMPLDYIKSYEDILGIVGNPSTESLSFRRQRLINRMSTKPPFSLEFLYARLNEIVGVNNWVVNMDYPNHTLYVESSARDQQWAGELSITIHSIKPANIVYVPVPAIFGRIHLSAESRYSQDTANYVAGSWTVGAMDIVSYEDKGVIKMANTKTMKDKMFDNVLTLLDSSVVVSFRLNDTKVLPATKSLDLANNKLIVTREILASDGIVTLTKVELLDTDGAVIDEYQTAVPIIDGITLKYELSVGEGAV